MMMECKTAFAVGHMKQYKGALNMLKDMHSTEDIEDGMVSTLAVATKACVDKGLFTRYCTKDNKNYVYIRDAEDGFIVAPDASTDCNAHLNLKRLGNYDYEAILGQNGYDLDPVSLSTVAFDDGLEGNEEMTLIGIMSTMRRK